MKNTKWILELQVKTRRTSKGRDIGDSLMPIIENSLRNPELEDASMMECRNCSLVLDDEYFSDGCSNCGSKDFDEFTPPAEG
jgi:hypothetical protein